MSITAISKIRETIRLHINIPKTLYFNFKVFELKQAIRFPVFLYGKVQLEGLHKGCVELLTKNRMGGVKIGGGWFTEMFGYSNRHTSFLRIRGKLVLGDDIHIQQGVLISIDENAIVEIGNNVRFNERVTLHSKMNIIIQDSCRIGWNTQIIDTGFHYFVNKERLTYRHAPVVLEHNVWVANGVSIMKGTYLPAYTIVASNSLVNKNYLEMGEHCLIGGVPAKYITDGVERLLLKDAEIDNLFGVDVKELNYEDIKSELTKGKYQP